MSKGDKRERERERIQKIAEQTTEKSSPNTLSVVFTGVGACTCTLKAPLARAR